MEQIAHIQQQFQPDLQRVNDIIARQLRSGNQLMDPIVRRYLSVKGKQIRPLLVLISAKMFGHVTDEALHAAAALEMLHNASLIHDDIVDETELRRGQPTINATFGNHVAVLVGDYFVSKALAAAIHTGNTLVIAALSQLGAELALGEIDQISNARRNTLDEDAYFAMIRQKTASLFMNCVRMGADVAGAPHSQRDLLVRYAELLGLCFQIKDDIFDYFEDPRIGKPTGNDLREGKITLPLLHALRTQPQSDTEPLLRLLADGRIPAQDEINLLIDFAITRGGIDYAYSRMRHLQIQASQIIAPLPQSPSRKALEDLFEYIIARKH